MDGAGGYLSLLLWRLLGDDALRAKTPYAARSREEGHLGVALETPHCPAYIQRWLAEKRLPFWRKTRRTWRPAATSRRI